MHVIIYYSSVCSKKQFTCTKIFADCFSQLTLDRIVESALTWWNFTVPRTWRTSTGSRCCFSLNCWPSVWCSFTFVFGIRQLYKVSHPRCLSHWTPIGLLFFLQQHKRGTLAMASLKDIPVHIAVAQFKWNCLRQVDVAFISVLRWGTVAYKVMAPENDVGSGWLSCRTGKRCARMPAGSCLVFWETEWCWVSLLV